jgi:hypothetical protein
MNSAARDQYEYRPPAWAPPACELGDIQTCAETMERNGVVVFRSVATAADLQRGEELFWDWAESVRPGVKRHDASTHTTKVWNSLGYKNSGVMAQESAGQSAFLWHCRLLPKVRDAFATLWGLRPQSADSRELITSFDGCGSWRNAWLQVRPAESVHPSTSGHKWAQRAQRAHLCAGGLIVCSRTPFNHSYAAPCCCTGC